MNNNPRWTIWWFTPISVTKDIHGESLFARRLFSKHVAKLSLEKRIQLLYLFIQAAHIQQGGKCGYLKGRRHGSQCLDENRRLGTDVKLVLILGLEAKLLIWFSDSVSGKMNRKRTSVSTERLPVWKFDLHSATTYRADWLGASRSWTSEVKLRILYWSECRIETSFTIWATAFSTSVVDKGDGANAGRVSGESDLDSSPLMGNF